MIPTIAIVGRPNVGKSTLFNRLIGEQKSIISNIAGTTRDRVFGTARRSDGSIITLVDTGGFQVKKTTFTKAVNDQIGVAMAEADGIIAVFDTRESLTLDDFKLIEQIRRTDKPVYYCINKVDTKKHEKECPGLYELGIDTFFRISATHNRGIANLHDAMYTDFNTTDTPTPAPSKTDTPPRVAVVGKPNVGKSSLVNALLGTTRTIVSNKPGTTLDAVDTEIVFRDKTYTFVDTAGIRRKKAHDTFGYLSTIRAIRGISNADVVLLLIDGTEGYTQQDLRIANITHEHGRGLIVAINKCDIIPIDIQHGLKRYLARHLPFLNYAPVIMISAAKRKGFKTIFAEIEKIRHAQHLRIKTNEFNRFIQKIVEKKSPPLQANRRIKLFFGTQIKSQPPTFIIKTNAPREIPHTYKRYVINSLREHFAFYGNPIHLFFRDKARSDPE